MANNTAPIIIRKVVEEGGHGGHHGGAWKVAYADFVTAMMAFFLMLWLLSSASDDKLKGLAEYFSDATINQGGEGGVGGVMGGISFMTPNQMAPASLSPFNFHPTIPYAESDEGDPFMLELSSEEADGDEDLPAEGSPDAEALSDAALAAETRHREEAAVAEVRDEIMAKLAGIPELEELADSVAIDRTPDGLRIQLIDRDDRSMFPLAGAQMLPHTTELLKIVAETIKDLPQRLSIRGHTDALPFTSASGYDNWRLSSDRANATRQALIGAGIGETRVREVVGRASADPYLPDSPSDPRNRRISLVLLNETAAATE